MEYRNKVVVMVPDEIATRLKAAAKAQVMTKSEYVRRALMEKLERETDRFSERSG